MAGAVLFFPLPLLYRAGWIPFESATIVSISVISCSSILSLSASRPGVPILKHRAVETDLTRFGICHIKLVFARPASCRPQTIAAPEFLSVFGKADIAGKWQLTGNMRNHCCDILVRVAFEAGPVAYIGCTCMFTKAQKSWND